MPQVNGDKLTPSDVEDLPALPASADVSGGSDTEVTRPEYHPQSVLPDSEAKGHHRSNSVKKPASFKAVSVTKNFLAKAANGTPQPSKLGGEKGFRIFVLSSLGIWTDVFFQ